MVGDGVGDVVGDSVGFVLGVRDGANVDGALLVDGIVLGAGLRVGMAEG